MKLQENGKLKPVVPKSRIMGEKPTSSGPCECTAILLVNSAPVFVEMLKVK